MPVPSAGDGPLFSFIFTATTYTWRNDYSIWLQQKTSAGWVAGPFFRPARDQVSLRNDQRICYHIGYLILVQEDTSYSLSTFLHPLVLSLVVHPAAATAEHL